jgi:hypothetical protein
VTSAIDQAIIAAHHDLGWTLRQRSYTFGLSVKTITAIPGPAGAPRRPQCERQTGRPSPAELIARLRYAQRGLPAWAEYGLNDDRAQAARSAQQDLVLPRGGLADLILNRSRPRGPAVSWAKPGRRQPPAVECLPLRAFTAGGQAVRNEPLARVRTAASWC